MHTRMLWLAIPILGVQGCFGCVHRDSTSTSSSSSGTSAASGSPTGGTGATSSSAGTSGTNATTGTSSSSGTSATTGTSSSAGTGTTSAGTSGTSGGSLVCPSSTDALPTGPFTVGFSGAASDRAGGCSGAQVFRTSYAYTAERPERLHVHTASGAVALVDVEGCGDTQLACGADLYADLQAGQSYVVAFESPDGTAAPAEVRHEWMPTGDVDCASAFALDGVDNEVHGLVLNGFSPPSPSPTCAQSTNGSTYFDQMQGNWFSLHVAAPSAFTAELRSDPEADLVLIDGSNCNTAPTSCAVWNESSFDTYTQLSTTLQPGDYLLAIVANANTSLSGGSYGLYTHLEPLSGATVAPNPDPALACVEDGPVLPGGTFTVTFDGGPGVSAGGCGLDGGYRQVFRLPASPNPLAVRLSSPDVVELALREPGCVGEGHESSCAAPSDAGAYADGMGPLAIVESPSGAPATVTAQYYELPAGNYDCASAALIEPGAHEFQAYTGQPFVQPPATIPDCEADGGGPHYPGGSGAYFRIDVAQTSSFTADLLTNTYADLVLQPASSCGAAPLLCAAGDSSCVFSCSYSTHLQTTLPAGSYYLSVISAYTTDDHYGLFTQLGP